jgi:putative membrane protein
MRKAFEQGRATKSDKYYRVWNEVPTVLMIAIVILVVIQPF